MSDATERAEHDAADIEEMHSQVAWLEARGWSVGDDGLWRHPDKAADVGLTHSQAFTVQARTGDPGGSQILDTGPAAARTIQVPPAGPKSGVVGLALASGATSLSESRSA